MRVGDKKVGREARPVVELPVAAMVEEMAWGVGVEKADTVGPVVS